MAGVVAEPKAAGSGPPTSAVGGAAQGGPADTTAIWGSLAQRPDRAMESLAAEKACASEPAVTA